MIDIVALIGVLSVPHLLYLWVWTNPKAYTKLQKQLLGAAAHPVESFATIAGILKCTPRGMRS